ncbi:hypothetical protein L1987_30091 [Smallanthus sonchifolius]|uniref:Uncharacterized protein n=1 Tax=Smallanthus sonchifolius TaxID=185202 RepID=A0ACB9I3C8_9ASTR|nr:hypothetical protein L1987_30091 [Smallanthus sonchifolius]
MLAHDMNLRKKESFGQPQIQDPSMYFGVNSTIKPSGSGIALYLGSPQEEEHTLGGGNHTGFIASGSSQHHQSSSRNTTFTSSTNQSASAKIVEDHVALFSSCMLAYENFIGGKLTDPETIEEDFNQVDPHVSSAHHPRMNSSRMKALRMPMLRDLSQKSCLGSKRL